MMKTKKSLPSQELNSIMTSTERKIKNGKTRNAKKKPKYCFVKS